MSQQYVGCYINLGGDHPYTRPGDIIGCINTCNSQGHAYAGAQVGLR